MWNKLCVEIPNVLTVLVKSISFWDVAVSDSLFSLLLPQVIHNHSVAVIARGQMETICCCCFGYALQDC